MTIAKRLLSVAVVLISVRAVAQIAPIKPASKVPEEFELVTLKCSNVYDDVVSYCLAKNGAAKLYNEGPSAIGFCLSDDTRIKLRQSAVINFKTQCDKYIARCLKKCPIGVKEHEKGAEENLKFCQGAVDQLAPISEMKMAKAKNDKLDYLQFRSDQCKQKCGSYFSDHCSGQPKPANYRCTPVDDMMSECRFDFGTASDAPGNTEVESPH